MMIEIEGIFLNIQFLLSIQLSHYSFDINLFNSDPHFLDFFVQFLSRLGDNLPQRCIKRRARLRINKEGEAFYNLICSAHTINYSLLDLIHISPAYLEMVNVHG